MLDTADQLLRIDDFARLTLRSTQDVLRSLESGRLIGRKIEDEWYVDATQVATSSERTKSEAETLMCAAAATDWPSVLAPIEARETGPFKAPTVELGMSIADIHLEAEHARSRALGYDIVIGIVSLFGIYATLFWLASFNRFSSNSSQIMILLVVLATIAVFDFLSRRMAKRRARQILGASAAGRSYDAADSVRNAPNVITSGGYSPFVGAGVGIGGWSFAMNLAQAEDTTLPVKEATVQALYAEAQAALDVLGIPDLVIRDELYVDGRDVRDVAQLMPFGPFQRPVNVLDADDMARHVGNDDDRCRHYKVIRAVLWNGQVVLSTFVRYVIVKNVLFVEARSFVLPPLSRQFLELRNLPLVPYFSERMKDVLYSFLRATYIWAPILGRAWAAVEGVFFSVEGRAMKLSMKEVRANQRYNYGWETSLREQWAGTGYERYFQMVDLNFCEKVLQESLLDSLLKSLQARNICTESLKSASTVIHNEGVIVNGGSLRAGNLTTGRSAQSTVNRSASPLAARSQA